MSSGLSTESNHAPSFCKEVRRIKPARTNARTCTTRTCTATSATFRYDRILVSLSPSFPLRSFPPESPPNFLTPTTHPTDNQAPELEALVQAIAGIRGIDAVAAAAADTAVVVPTLTIGSDTQKLHVAADRLEGLCGAIDKRLTSILDKCQEASHLLDKHLESIVTPIDPPPRSRRSAGCSNTRAKSEGTSYVIHTSYIRHPFYSLPS